MARSLTKHFRDRPLGRRAKNVSFKASFLQLYTFAMGLREIMAVIKLISGNSTNFAMVYAVFLCDLGESNRTKSMGAPWRLGPWACALDDDDDEAVNR